MKTIVLLTGAAAVLIATGIVHGLRTDRWGVSEEVVVAAERLDKIPTTVGDWESQPEEIERRQLLLAGVVGHVARRYVHRPTGRSIVILIVCGRPGVIGVHSPDVCFQGAGFEILHKPAKRAVKSESQSAEFWQTVAAKGEPRPETLSLWWAWSSDGATWEASTNPRGRYLRSAYLYKFYLIRPVGDPKVGDDAPTVSLIEELLPKIKQSLTPTTPNPKS
jgi:hypothetical protein